MRFPEKAVLAGLVLLPAALQAQSGEAAMTYYSCYVPGSGSVYRIRETGLPQE